MARVWKEEEIRILVQTNDKVLYGALRKLYDCQTDDEIAQGSANHKNGYGFNGFENEKDFPKHRGLRYGS